MVSTDQPLSTITVSSRESIMRVNGANASVSSANGSVHDQRGDSNSRSMRLPSVSEPRGQLLPVAGSA